jgi:pyruvate formate lyase activating enzyme
MAILFCLHQRPAPTIVHQYTTDIQIVYFIDNLCREGYIFSMQSGTIFDIKKYSINDGPGIRTTVFFKGCPLDCWWCHNPESKALKAELMYRANRCTLCAECVPACPLNAIEIDPRPLRPLSQNWERGMGGDGVFAITDRSICDNCGLCAEVCYNNARELVGREMTVAQVMKEIERDVPFFDQSKGGVTFSGGEPLLQRKFLAELLKNCREHEIHTVVDTSGFASWEAFDSIRGDVNLFLYDLKLMDDERHKQFTGVSNKLILENLRRLDEAGAPCVVRIPLIPGVNDDEENVRESGKFLAALKNVIAVDLMGYHDIARAKYEALGLAYRLSETKAPSAEKLQAAANMLESFGLNVKVS